MSDISGELYFIFGSITQSLLKNCNYLFLFTATGIFEKEGSEIQVSKVYMQFVCVYYNITLDSDI